MTTGIALYCEGCERTDLPLSSKGYCPLCTEVACQAGNGHAVGLLPQLPVDIFQARLGLERALSLPTNGFLRTLVRVCRTCSECEQNVPQMSRMKMTEHVFGPRSTIFIACEGYHTSLYRAASLLMRGEEV